jgi:hypothetical protein
VDGIGHLGGGIRVLVIAHSITHLSTLGALLIFCCPVPRSWSSSRRAPAADISTKFRRNPFGASFLRATGQAIMMVSDTR